MQSSGIVWLASYPKSGNTWMRLLLGNLLALPNDGEKDRFAPIGDITGDRRAFERYTGINSYELTAAEIDRLRPEVYRKMTNRSKQLTFVKAHDAFSRLPDGQPIFPADCTRAAIYIVRDPMDVAVSYAHHRGEPDFDKAVADMNDSGKCVGGGKEPQLGQFLGDWSAHYHSWARQNDIPVCVVRYEDLRHDTLSTLQKVVQFIGLDAESFHMPIDAAVEAARFDRLQQIEDEQGFQERPFEAKRFFRTGRSGEGREKLSKVLQDKLIACHAEMMSELGYLEERSGE